MKRTQIQHTFRSGLQALQRRLQWRAGVFGASRALVPAGAVLLLAIWSAGGPTRPEGFLALGLAASALAAVLALLWEQLFKPLMRLRRSRDVVRHLEREGDFANTLVSAEEALRDPERWPARDDVQRELQKRLFASANRHLEYLRADQVIRYPQPRATLGLALGVLCLWGVFLVQDPGTVGRGTRSLLHPWADNGVVPTGGILPEALPAVVVAGQDMDLLAADFTLQQGPAVCEVRTGQGLWRALETRSVPVERESTTLTAPFRRWGAVLPEVQEDFSWRFRRGSVVSPERAVVVRHHPLLTALGGEVHPPAYTGLPARNLSRLPARLDVPEGALIEIRGRTNHAVRHAGLVLATGDTLSLAVAGRELSGSLAISEELHFTPTLTDSFGLHIQAPLEISIQPFPDRAPLVQLSRVGDDGTLPLDGKVVLQVEAMDDYGLDHLSLETRLGDEVALEEFPWEGGVFWRARSSEETARTWELASGPLSLELGFPETQEGLLHRTIELKADFSAVDLVPGDILELRILAVDNRRPGTGQEGRSRVLRLQLPSAADVLAAQAEASEERRGELEEMRRRGRQLDADLDRLNRELMKNPLPDWARRQEMQAAVERQQTMQKELSRLADQLQQDLDRLASGQMTSQAMLDKAEELSQLLNQSPEQALQELLDKLKEAGGEARPQELADAIREVSRNQKEMARRLDAALAMLKRMEREQDMEGLTALLEQMIRKQQELADLSRQLAEQEGADQESADQEGQAGEGGEDEGQQGEGQDNQGESIDGQENSADGDQDQAPSPEDLARRQEALAQELEDLQERLEEALEHLQQDQAEGDDSAGGEKMEQALQEALDQLEQQQKQGSMQKAGEKLAEMDPETAAQMQQQALRDLGSLYHVLLESQEAMQMAMQQQHLSSLRQLAADLLALSSRQEEIAARIPLLMRDVRTRELTRGQHRLQKAAAGVRERLSLLMDEAPMRVMKLLAKLDDLIESMGHTVQAMEDNRGPAARNQAMASLAETNRLVIGLLTEAQMQSQGSGGGGSGQQQSLAQKLQQMAGEQAKLNGMTEQLRQMLANRGLSQEVRSQMKRLGEAQGALGGRMNELEDEDRPEGSEGERLLGDMGEMGRQMEMLSREIDDGLVSEETLIRQERILSRLLDARNSVRRRDYTTRRESRNAQRLYDVMQGGEGQDGAGDEAAEFRRRYRALEKAPLEYRDLVRRYFSTLDSLRHTGPEGLVPTPRETGPVREDTP